MPTGQASSPFRVTDTVTGGRLAADGVTVIPSDGIDLLVNVDNATFADQTINFRAYFDKPPTLDLHYQLTTQNQTVASDSFSGFGNAYSRGSGWAGAWTETGDNNSSSSGQIQVNNNALRFDTGDGASIQRAVDFDGPVERDYQLLGQRERVQWISSCQRLFCGRRHEFLTDRHDYERHQQRRDA